MDGRRKDAEDRSLCFLRMENTETLETMPGDCWQELISDLKLLHDLPDSGYTADIISKQIVVPKLISKVRQYEQKAVDAFSEEDVAAILEMMAVPELIESVVQLLGYISTYTNRFSRMMQDRTFLEFLVQYIPEFPEALVDFCFTLLANCCVDYCDSSAFLDSGFVNFLLEIPTSLWSSEFLRLLGALVNSTEIKGKVASKLMDVYVICLTTPNSPHPLKVDSIRYLYNLSRKDHRKSIATEKMIPLLEHIPALLGTQDKTIVRNTIRLCSEALEHCSNFSVLVETSDLFTWLTTSMNTFVEFRCEVMNAITNYTKFCQSFDQTQAIQLAEVPWDEIICGSEFDFRLSIIATVRKLVAIVPSECVWAMVTDELIMGVLEMLDSTEIDARREVYHFLCQICTCEAIQHPDFRSMFVTALRNSELLEESLQEDFMSDDGNLVEMAEATTQTLKPLMEM